MTIVVDPDLAPPSGTSLDDLVSRVRRELVDRDNLNQLAVDVDDSQSTFTLSHTLSAITRGTMLSIDDEISYVWSADAASKTVEVNRGYGTASSPHTNGALVSADGKSRKQIIDAINDELMSLSGRGLYQMKSTILSGYTPGFVAYPVPQIASGNVYAVQIQDWRESDDWINLPGCRVDAIDNTLKLPDMAWSFISGNQLRVLYKAPFDRINDGADDVSVASGLHSEAFDVLVWGATARLTASDEYKRNDFRSQGDTRRSDEVPAKAVAIASSQFGQMRDMRLSEEKDRLRRRFPTVKIGY